MKEDDRISGAAVQITKTQAVRLKEPRDHPSMMLLAVHRRAMAMVCVAPLLAFRIFFDRDCVTRLAVVPEHDVRQAFTMAVARMRRLRAGRRRMLTELAGRQYG